MVSQNQPRNVALQNTNKITTSRPRKSFWRSFNETDGIDPWLGSAPAGSATARRWPQPPPASSPPRRRSPAPPVQPSQPPPFPVAPSVGLAPATREAASWRKLEQQKPVRAAFPCVPKSPAGTNGPNFGGCRYVCVLRGYPS